MGRIVMGCVALGIVGFIGYRTMYGRVSATRDVSAPKQKLENVQKAADRIEAQQQKAADDVLGKSNPE